MGGFMQRSAFNLARASFRAASSRSLATEAAPTAPITLHGLDGRYATSLWRVASTTGEVGKVEKDLAAFKTQLGNEAMTQLLSNPSIPKKAKIDAVGALMKKSGFAQSTQNFFSLLENGRLNETAQIIDKFEQLQSAAKGEIVADVTVADELTAAQKKSLEKSLKSFLDKGAKLSLNVQVKPEILGLVVDVGDKHINMSIL